MNNAEVVTFGDNVRILRTDLTNEAGYADKHGVCSGVTTPSVTGVEVIGPLAEDVALNVHFEDDDIADAWFDPALVELIDHAGGTVAQLGDKTFLRDDDGEWYPA